MVLKTKSILLILLSLLFVGCASYKYSVNIADPAPINATAENVIIFVAHQDDETFILTKIIEHLKSGDNLHVIYTSLSYQNGESYKNKRILESKTALKSIGVDSDNVLFLGYPDGRTYKYLKEIIYKTDSLFYHIKPDIVYTSAFEGGHIDHDIANFVISYLMTSHDYLSFEFPQYSGYKTWLTFKLRSFPKKPETHIRKLTKYEFQKVKEYWKYYESQHFPFGFYMSMTRGKKKSLGYLFLRKQPQYDYLELPPTGNVAYKKYLKADFNDFKNSIFEIIPAANSQ